MQNNESGGSSKKKMHESITKQKFRLMLKQEFEHFVK